MFKLKLMLILSLVLTLIGASATNVHMKPRLERSTSHAMEVRSIGLPPPPLPPPSTPFTPPIALYQGISWPTSVVKDSIGDIYFIDSRNHRICKYYISNRTISTFVYNDNAIFTKLTYVKQITQGGQDIIYVSTSSRVILAYNTYGMSLDNNRITLPISVDNPIFHPNGSLIYVLYRGSSWSPIVNSTISVYNMNGTLVRTITPYRLITSITIDQYNTIYAVTYGTYEIVKIYNNGTISSLVPYISNKQYFAPSTVVVMACDITQPQPELYVTVERWTWDDQNRDQYYHVIVQFSNTGQQQHEFTTLSPSLSAPRDMFLSLSGSHDRSLYVADTKNNRILVINAASNAIRLNLTSPYVGFNNIPTTMILNGSYISIIENGYDSVSASRIRIHLINTTNGYYIQTNMFPLPVLGTISFDRINHMTMNGMCIYVCFNTNSRDVPIPLWKWTRMGRLISFPSSAYRINMTWLSSPTTYTMDRIATNVYDDLYTIDQTNQQIIQFSSNGTFIRHFNASHANMTWNYWNHPNDIVMDETNRVIYVLIQQGQIMQLTYNMTHIQTITLNITTSSGASGIPLCQRLTLDEYNNIYILCNPLIIMLSSTFQQLTQFVTDNMDHTPRMIDIVAYRGYVYALDTTSNRMIAWGTNNVTSQPMNTPTVAPTSIPPNNNSIPTNSTRPTSPVPTSTPTPTPTPSPSPSPSPSILIGCSYPSDIAMDSSSHIYAVCQTSNMVLKYDPYGTIIAQLDSHTYDNNTKIFYPQCIWYSSYDQSLYVIDLNLIYGWPYGVRMIVYDGDTNDISRVFIIPNVTTITQIMMDYQQPPQLYAWNPWARMIHVMNPLNGDMIRSMTIGSSMSRSMKMGIDSSNQLYVIDTNGNNMYVYDMNGNLLHTYPIIPNSGINQIMIYNQYMFISYHDNSYENDHTFERIECIDMTYGGIDQVIMTWTTYNPSFRSPSTMVMNHDGTMLYVADSGNERIVGMAVDLSTPYTTHIPIWSTMYPPIVDPSGITFDGMGNMYVTQYTSAPYNSIHIITMNPNVTSISSVGYNPSQIQAVYPVTPLDKYKYIGISHDQQYIYVTTSYYLYQLDRHAGISTLFRMNVPWLTYPRDYYPFGLAVTNNDDIMISDVWNMVILTFNRTGSIINVYNTTNPSLSKPMGIALDRQQNIYIADNGNSRIVKLSSNGTFIRAFHANNTNTSTFSPVNIVIYDVDNSILFSDPPNNRILHLSHDGMYIRNYTLPFSSVPLYRIQFPFTSTDGANSLAIYRDTLYVVDCVNHRIVTFPIPTNTPTLTPTALAPTTLTPTTLAPTTLAPTTLAPTTLTPTTLTPTTLTPTTLTPTTPTPTLSPPSTVLPTTPPSSSPNSSSTTTGRDSDTVSSSSSSSSSSLSQSWLLGIIISAIVVGVICVCVVVTCYFRRCGKHGSARAYRSPHEQHDTFVSLQEMEME